MTFEIYWHWTTARGAELGYREWRWRLVAANGRIVANGAEGYKRRIDCVRMVGKIQLSAQDAEVKIENTR